MNFYVVIPARYDSTRLPGKPLAQLAGKPMIQHVYERAGESGARNVIIATDDHRVAEVAEDFGARVCMTSREHRSGTDRLQEAVAQLKLPPETVVVNVQGDEPLIPPEVIDQVAHVLAGMPEASAATLCEPLGSGAEFFDPNVVKVLADNAGRALYFSRAPIPWPRDRVEQLREQPELPGNFPARRHIGIYAYRADLLNRFVTWPPGALEVEESLEQLRVLERGEVIGIAEACARVPAGVDTPEDLARVAQLMEN